MKNFAYALLSSRGLVIGVTAVAVVGGGWYLLARSSSSTDVSGRRSITIDPPLLAVANASDASGFASAASQMLVSRGVSLQAPDKQNTSQVRDQAWTATIARLSQSDALLQQRELLTRLQQISDDDVLSLTPEGMLATASSVETLQEFREYLHKFFLESADLRLGKGEQTEIERAEYATAMLMAAEAMSRNPKLNLNDSSEAVQMLWSNISILNQDLQRRLIGDLAIEIMDANPSQRLNGNRPVWLRYQMDRVAATGDIVAFNRAVDEWSAFDTDQRLSMQGWRFRVRISVLSQNAPREVIQQQSSVVWQGLNGLSTEQIIAIGSDWLTPSNFFTGTRRENYLDLARAFLPAIEQQIQRRQNGDSTGLADLIAFRDEVRQRMPPP
jgi:hypothetical protein